MVSDANSYRRTYWEGGNEDGSGYKGVGYQNFAAQLVVLDKILKRKPESLLDIGGSRGYLAKMFEQKTGKPGYCLDISPYCQATRVTDRFILGDISDDFNPLLTVFDRVSPEKPVDLVFSIAVFEHLKEQDLPLVIKRLSIIAKRGLICPSFYDVGEPDHTHETLKPKEWWEAQFAKYAPGWPVEIVDKEEMEKSEHGIFYPPKTVKVGNQNWTIAGQYVDQDIETLSKKNNRAIVLNISSYVVMFRSTEDICIVNTDVPEINWLPQYASDQGYNFTTYRAPGKIPFTDNSVNEINVSHMFEHLSREDGSVFLKECWRVLKPDGRIRIAVPDAFKIAEEFVNFDGKTLTHHGVYNIGVQDAEDSAQAFWHMITSNGEHKTAYDEFALVGKILQEGFTEAGPSRFDDFTDTPLIGKVGWDMYPESSLYVVGRRGSETKNSITVNIETQPIPEKIAERFPVDHTVKIKFSKEEAIEQGLTLDVYKDIQAGATTNVELHKIALIAPPFIEVNPNKYGGLERVVSNLGKGLAKKGYDVTVIAADGSEVEGCNIFPTGKPVGMAVNWLEAERNQSLTYKDLLEKGKFDIIHDHTWFSRVYLLKKFKSVGICHTHHGHLNPQWVEFVKSITPTPNLIAISNWMKRLYLAQYRIFAKTAYNGIDIDLHKYNPNIEVSDRLLFVGRIDELKRPDIALDVAEKAGIPIDVVGSVDWSAHKEYAQKVVDRAAKLGKVYLEASTDLKVRLMQEARAVLVPSMFGEPFGLVVAESMACGAPVIALDDGGINEIIQNDVMFPDIPPHGVTCDTPSDMVSVLTLSNLNTKDGLVRSARSNYIKENFSLESMTNKHVKLYNQILRGDEW